MSGYCIGAQLCQLGLLFAMSKGLINSLSGFSDSEKSLSGHNKLTRIKFQGKKNQSEDWPFTCGTSGRTRTDTLFKAPDFDANLSPFDVARLYHHPH